MIDMLKTHLIVTDVHEEYSIRWFGSIANLKLKLQNNLPIFVIIGTDGRVELNTLDIKRIEDCAKHLTHPKGRQSVTSDTSHIYVKEENGSEKMIGSVTHYHIKTFQQMYDPFERI